MVDMIKENLKFSNFSDFYIKRCFIKEKYNNLSTYDKTLYKYYVYSRRYLREKTCDAIWEYLNSRDEEELFVCETYLKKENMRYF